MNPIIIDKKSWHYHLATTYGFIKPWELGAGEVDICSYTRNGLISGLMIISLIIFFVSICTVCMVVPFSWFAASAVAGTWISVNGDDALFFVGLMEWSLLGVLILAEMFTRAVKWLAKHFPLPSKKPSTSSGFLSQAYDSFKNKYCVKVKLKQEGGGESI